MKSNLHWRMRRVSLPTGWLLILATGLLLGNESCPPSSSGGGSAPEKRKGGGGGVGVGVTIDLGGIGQRRAAEDPFAEPPKESKPKSAPPKVAIDGKVVSFDERGRPINSAPAKGTGCCVFTALTIQNTWGHPVAVEIRDENGTLTGSAQIPVGGSHAFQGELGKCVRISVTSSRAAHSLIEDVRICCKEMGQKALYFYGIRLVNYASRPCTEKEQGGPRDAPAVASGGSTAQSPDDPRDQPTATPSPPPPQGGIRLPGPVVAGGPPTAPPPGGTTVGTGPGPGTGTGTRLRPTGDDPRDGPVGDDPRDADVEKLGLLFTRMQDDWLPENGNVISVQVQIFAKNRVSGKWIYPGPPRMVTVRFVERSSEKGICLNSGNQTAPDLAFLPGMNSPWNCSASGGSADFPDVAVSKGPVQTALLNLNSFDYGSFSRLEAISPGCVPLRQLPTGEVIEITPAEAQLAVPRDDNRNQIADVWIEDWISRTSDEDVDANPTNPLIGDGLSAYEEYRGFMVKGRHLRTSVDEKDLFLHNPGNFPVAKLRSFSGLWIHEVDKPEYEEATRIVNFNRGHAARPHAQHLIKISQGDASGEIPGILGECVPEGGVRFGPPKNVQEVRIFFANHLMPIPGLPPGPAMLDANQMAATVAHEVGHALGNWHHGDGMAKFVWLRPPGDNTPSPDSTLPVRYHDHPGVSFGGLSGGMISLPMIFPVADAPCTHSGPWYCVMRYRMPVCTVFYRGGVFTSMMAADDTDPDSEFCRVTAGTGRNSGGRLAGDCAPGRGNCWDNLRVSDAHSNNPP